MPCMYVCDDVIQFYCMYSYVIFCLYIEMNMYVKKIILKHCWMFSVYAEIFGMN
jgi:hypothetical protein